MVLRIDDKYFSETYHGSVYFAFDAGEKARKSKMSKMKKKSRKHCNPL